MIDGDISSPFATMHITILLSNLLMYSQNLIAVMWTLNWVKKKSKTYIQGIVDGQSESLKKVHSFKKLLRLLCH